jgi:uncharacterized protein
MDDRAVVTHQLGRAPRAFHAVAARCPWGLPAVTEQHPYDTAGAPFPTTFYLTCRHLVAAVSRLEAAGGVERWSNVVASDPDLAADLVRATAEQRHIRHALAAGRTGADDGLSLDSGIAGSHNPTQLKCLHAHAAFALARPGYLLGERVLAELPQRWPSIRCCTSELASPSVAPGTDIDSARREWEDGFRRLTAAAARDPAQAEDLHRHVELVTGELRRRVGSTFTLADLARAYPDSERWSHTVLEEADARPGWIRSLAMVSDAAFHLYARGAADYAP